MNNSLNGKFRGPHLHRGTQSIDETRNKESEIKARHHSPKVVVPRILYIIRPDGSFVLQTPHTELGDFFKQLQKQPDSTANELSEESSIKEFGAALKKREEYVTTVDVNGEKHQIYGIPLP